MISLIFWSLAAICNAVMDVLQNHFTDSVFTNRIFNAGWWDPNRSWVNKYKFKNPRYGRNNKPIIFTDAWHLFKFLMLTFLGLSIVTFDKDYLYETNYLILPVLVVYSLLWGMVFELFYKHLLRK